MHFPLPTLHNPHPSDTMIPFATLFASLKGWGDSGDKATECRDKISAIRTEERRKKEVEERRERERREAEEKARRDREECARLRKAEEERRRQEREEKRRKKEQQDKTDYTRACMLVAEGTYASLSEAESIFTQLGDYQDSKDKAEICRQQLEPKKRKKSIAKYALIIILAFICGRCHDNLPVIR